MQPEIENEPSYVFNTREYKENSLILSVLTLNYGIVSVMVRGSNARSVLQPFTPLKLSLKPSKTDLYFLSDFECCGETYDFKLPILFCATYLNELLYHLYHSKEANPMLFGTYVATLDALQQQKQIEQHLRIFELTLLECLGYGLSPIDQNGQPLQAKQLYRFGIGMGFIPVNQAPSLGSNSKRAFLRTIAELKSTPETAPTPMPAPALDASLSNTAATTTTSSSSPTASNQAASWSDEDLEDAMLFSKHKVKGPKLEARSSVGAWGMEQYAGVTTPDGRPINLSELIGPALPGAVLSKIVNRSFDADLLKQSKQLTNALFQFLLGKREIKSRQMYRDYLQLQAQGKTAQASVGATASDTTTTESQAVPAGETTTQMESSQKISSQLSPSAVDATTTTASLTTSNAATASSLAAAAITATTTTTAPAKEGEVLQQAAAKVEAALKEEQLKQSTQKAKSRKTKAKTKATTTTTEPSEISALASDETSVDSKQPAATLAEGKSAQKTKRKPKQPLPGEVVLEPSAALLASEAKAQAELSAQLATAKRKTRKTTAKSKTAETTKSTADDKTPLAEQGTKTEKKAKAAKRTKVLSTTLEAKAQDADALEQLS